MLVTSESFPLTISIDNNIAVMKVSFDDRHLAKNNGFKWNPDKKYWYMDGRYFALKREELTENLSLVFPEGCSTETKESYGKHPLLDSCLASLKMKPYPYQIDGINYALHNNYCVIGDEMGCIDGEAEVTINRGGASRKYKISDVNKRFGITWDDSIPTKIRCLYQGELRSLEMKKIQYSGTKKTIEITTSDGKKIKATPDHLFMTPEGWRECGSLKKGDKLLVNGELTCKMCGGTKDVATYKYAEYHGFCKDCINHYLRKGREKGETIGRDGYVYVTGMGRHPNSKTQNMRIKQRLVIEAAMNDITLEEWIELVRKGQATKEMCLSSEFQVHHKNGIKTDNSIENLEVVSIKDHSIIHNKKLHLGVFIPKATKIKSIKESGKIEVYDITVPMADSFVANGFIVHNCGKTIQAIAVSEATRKNDKVLVCCPAFLKYNWSREVSKFTNMTSFIVRNKKDFPEALKSKADVIIINYEILEHAEDIFTISNVWIFDEAHALKNVRAKRTKLFAKYLKKDKPERLMLLSGTPIKNRVTEFYSLLSACSLSPVDCGIRMQDCGEFSTQWKFNQFFSHEVKTRFGTEFKGTRNIEVLRKVMVKKYIRHNVAEHLKELPPLIRNKIAYDDIPAADLKALDAELAEAVKAIGTKAAMSSAIASIKKGAAVLKVPGTVGHVLSLLEAGEPVGVFTDHVDSAESIAEAIKAAGFSACCITGKTPMDTRDGFVQAFQGGEIEAFVATIGAASTGLTLTRSRHCVFNDLPWVPSDFMQAEKRYHRIGQENTVFVSVLVAPGLDEYIVDMLLEKAAVMSTVLTEGKQKLLDFREV